MLVLTQIIGNIHYAKNKIISITEHTMPVKRIQRPRILANLIDFFSCFLCTMLSVGKGRMYTVNPRIVSEIAIIEKPIKSIIPKTRRPTGIPKTQIELIIEKTIVYFCLNS